MKLEIVILNPEMGFVAQDSGATQLNYLIAPNQGGLTPCLRTVEQLMTKAKIPVYIVVRHYPSHEYSKEVFDYMIDYVKDVKKLGVTGVIFGSIKDGKIDEKQLKAMLKASKGIEFVFNRAIDHVDDYIEGIKTLAKHGVNKVITGGGPSSAEDGVHNITKAKEYVDDILIAGGVGKKNLKKLIELTGIKQLHIGSDVWIKEENIDGNRIKEIRKVMEEL